MHLLYTYKEQKLSLTTIIPGIVQHFCSQAFLHLRSLPEGPSIDKNISQKASSSQVFTSQSSCHNGLDERSLDLLKFLSLADARGNYL